MKIPSLIKLDCSTIEESDSINKEEGPFPMRDGNRETKEKKKGIKSHSFQQLVTKVALSVTM